MTEATKRRNISTRRIRKRSEKKNKGAEAKKENKSIERVMAIF